ncbi:IS66 family insertion sequence element accessory protein TnpA [Bilifractor sp. LCP19S3_H10]|uniref:IS66 family insertion sequence element accessory protein TnpA n=1 Tax=Bilifractor sp. LCP19S3_H10 TaxID=3438736 RepID=UPI003F917BDE
MDKITSDVRHQRWLDIIHACNASGLTRKVWCEQNGIKIKTFYYWQHQLRREVHDAQMAALPAEPEVTFAEVALPAPPKPVSYSAIDFWPATVIRIRILTIRVSNHAFREVLSLIRSVMKNAT